MQVLCNCQKRKNGVDTPSSVQFKNSLASFNLNAGFEFKKNERKLD